MASGIVRPLVVAPAGIAVGAAAAAVEIVVAVVELVVASKDENSKNKIGTIVELFRRALEISLIGF